jgi:hypothetical protein
LAGAMLDAASALLEAEAPQAAAPGAPAPIWQSIGPSVIPNGQTYGTNLIANIGRVACVAVDPGNARHILCGGAGGGIWESFDEGATWAPRTDQMPSLAIGAIAFNSRDPKTVYAGSGEGNWYWFLGAGAYRSDDGGTTWRVLAAPAAFVGAGFFGLVVDPQNPLTLYAATTSGFFSSTNGGANWTPRRAGPCWGISVHPAGGSNTEILAAFADGLFISTNGGAAFTAVALLGAPSTQWTRLAVDRVVSSPDIAYVFGAAGANAYLWRRTGTDWRRIAFAPPSANPMVPQPWNQAQYDWYVAAL